MQIEAFAGHGCSWTTTRVVSHPASRDAVVIDPIPDLDTTPWPTSTDSLIRLLHFIEEQHLTLHWILDTRVRADHISAAAELKKHLQARLAGSANIDAGNLPAPENNEVAYLEVPPNYL